MFNLSAILEDSAHEVPRRHALVWGGARLSYAMLNSAANAVANMLRSRGIGPGDKVALCCPNLPQFPVIYFAILKAGAVAVPLNTLLDSWEFAYHLDDSDAKIFFCFEGTADLPIGERGFTGFQRAASCEHFIVIPANWASKASLVAGAEVLRQVVVGHSAVFGTVATDPGDTAVILYGSSTPDRLACGAEVSHLSMLLNAVIMDSLFPRTVHDRYLAALPLFHSFGQTVCMNMGLYRRATLVMLPDFEPRAALAVMQREHVTFLAGVPTMYWSLLTTEGTEHVNIEQIAADLNAAVCGGAALPAAVRRRFAQRFGVEVFEGYGLSETSYATSFSRPDRPMKPGSIGPPIWGVEMKLIDPNWNDIDGGGPGEVAIRGHNVMKGYYNRPAETAEVMRDGWFRTGDIGRRGDEGNYYIIGRSRDVIIRDGVTIYPSEIEEVLMAHPQVSLASVTGVPHDEHGEEIKAYVIRAHGAAIREQELVAWCAEALPADRYPRVVEFRDTLPMTATGKILKRELG
jgi:long-chain acyl-CoA synthetase